MFLSQLLLRRDCLNDFRSSRPFECSRKGFAKTNQIARIRVDSDRRLCANAFWRNDWTSRANIPSAEKSWNEILAMELTANSSVSACKHGYLLNQEEQGKMRQWLEAQGIDEKFTIIGSVGFEFDYNDFQCPRNWWIWTSGFWEEFRDISETAYGPSLDISLISQYLKEKGKVWTWPE
jgi:hypothetical protein